MNGQAARCKLVADLMIRCNFETIVETGTYRGTTTEWLSAFQIPIYSCEGSAENFGFSKARLAGLHNVYLLQMDSRAALRQLLSDPLASQLDRPHLFYLDAHWNSDLPLADELEIIFSVAENAVVLIDDFEVPSDSGYGFDNYGPGKALNVGYISDAVKQYGLASFAPSTSSTGETGARRGCVVLAKASSAITALVQATPLLKQTS